MMTIEDVKKMTKKELCDKETELLNKMESFANIKDRENNKWYQEIYHDYILVSDEVDKIVEDEMDEDDLADIEYNTKLFELGLLGPDPAKTRRSIFTTVK